MEGVTRLRMDLGHGTALRPNRECCSSIDHGTLEDPNRIATRLNMQQSQTADVVKACLHSNDSPQ